jgi:hypothetical protein
VDTLTNFVLSLVLNSIVALLIVRGIYYPSHRSKTHVFTFLALNTVLFFVLSLLTRIELGVGVGFGLFAIFSIMRYRTDAIPIREMTYMFVLAALPVLNSAGIGGAFWPQLLLANGAIVLVLYVLERGWGFRFESSRSVVYQGVAHTHPARRAELIAELRARTGLEVTRVAVGKLDFVRDTARLQVYFDVTDSEPGAPNGNGAGGPDDDD